MKPVCWLLALGAFCVAVLGPLHAQAQAEDEPKPLSEMSLEGRPAFVVEPVLAYPEAARRLGAEARIVARVVYDASGTPLRVAILRRDPVHLFLFDDAVRTALMKSRIAPRQSGSPETVYSASAPFNFTLEGSGYQGPQVVSVVEPEMPDEALNMGVSGWAAVLLPVDETGHQDMFRAQVVGRYPPTFKGFDEAALKVVRHYGFTSGRFKGQALAAWTIVRVDFRTPER